MSRAFRRFVLGVCTLALVASSPIKANAQEAGTCETGCAVAWIACITLLVNGYGDLDVCNFGYDGCMFGCNYPG